MFYSFLWSERGDKIKQDVMIGDYKNGGLRMIVLSHLIKRSNQHGSKNIWTMIIMVNGNYILTLNYTISAVMLSLKVTSTKTIWQSLYIDQVPL